MSRVRAATTSSSAPHLERAALEGQAVPVAERAEEQHAGNGDANGVTDQRSRVGRQRARGGGGDENRQPGGEHPAAAELVAEPAAGDEQHSGGDRVTGHHPFDGALSGPQTLLDGRQRHIHEKKSRTNMNVPDMSTISADQDRSDRA
jgi:hypothetical protein